MDDQTSIGELKEICRRYVFERDWQHDDVKELAVALSIEVGEVLEHFRFKSPEQVEAYLRDPDHYREVSHEVADVFYFIMTICVRMNLDLSEAYRAKMAINEQHYPVHLAKGSNKKWTEHLREQMQADGNE